MLDIHILELEQMPAVQPPFEHRSRKAHRHRLNLRQPLAAEIADLHEPVESVSLRHREGVLELDFAEQVRAHHVDPVHQKTHADRTAERRIHRELLRLAAERRLLRPEPGQGSLLAHFIDDLADRHQTDSGQLRDFRFGRGAVIQQEPLHEVHVALLDHRRRSGYPHDLTPPFHHS